MKYLKNTIKEYFLLNPTKRLRVREIERILKLPLPSIIRYCKELKEEGILTTEKIGNVTLYKASREKEYLLEKKLFNIKSIHESGLIEYLKQELNNPPIILFGSYSKGEDTEESDIDIYVETPSKKQIRTEKYNKLLKRNIQLFTYKSTRDIPNTHLANNILNGLILNGQIEVFK